MQQESFECKRRYFILISEVTNCLLWLSGADFISLESWSSRQVDRCSYTSNLAEVNINWALAKLADGIFLYSAPDNERARVRNGN